MLDSGVDYTRSVFGSCTSITQPSGCKVVYAQDFATNDNQLDDDGHGTNVAGIIARVAPGTTGLPHENFESPTHQENAKLVSKNTQD